MSNPVSPKHKQLQFRQAMAHLASAVNIVTTDGAAGQCGMTATAVCSVTDDPPTVLVCVNRDSEMNPVFKANQRLAINTLSSEQVEFAKQFAGMTDVAMEDRFSHADWARSMQHGQPILTTAINCLAGRLMQVVEYGTHSILLVELDEIHTHFDEDSAGLVYFARHFVAVRPAKH